MDNITIHDDAPESISDVAGAIPRLDEAPSLTLDKASFLVFAKEVQRTYAYVPASEVKPGLRLRVQSLTTTEVDAFEEESITGKSYKDQKLSLKAKTTRLVARGLVDEAGSRIVDPTDKTAMALLGRYHAAALNRAADKIRELSGMDRGRDDGEEDEEAD